MFKALHKQLSEIQDSFESEVIGTRHSRGRGDDSASSTDSDLSLVENLVDKDLEFKTLHPTVVASINAKEEAALGSATVLVYNKSPSDRKAMSLLVRPLCKRVIEVGDYDDAIDVIKRNNSDPTRVRNCVRLIIASLDSVSVRIIDHIQSRLTDPHISRMETIPVILTVDPSTLEQANSVLTTSTDASLSQNHHHVDLTNAGGHIHSLSSSLEKSVVCGYISSSAFPVNHDSQEDYRRHQKSIKKLAQDIIKKYAFVFAAYSNLRAAEKEFNYPKFYADYDEDDVPTTPPSADPKESASIPERAWKDTKDETDKMPGGNKGRLKMFGKNLMKNNKAVKTSMAIKKMVGGIDINFSENLMHNKLKNKKNPRPSVGLSSTDLRPKLYRRGGPKHIPPSTPKNAAGHFIETPKKGSAPNTPSSSRHDPNAVHIAPGMAPFIKRKKPELTSPRTSSGLSTQKVKTLVKLMKAHKEAKIAKLATGGARQATGAEKIKAMDKRDVHDEILGRNRTKSGVEKHEKEIRENAGRKVSGFALKLKAKMQARRESQAAAVGGDGQANENGKEEQTKGAAKSMWGFVKKGKDEDENNDEPKINPTPWRKDQKQARRKTSVKDTQQVSFVQVAIAAAAKKKQKVILKEVVKEAMDMPPDMLQYDLIEIKPSLATTSTANYFLRTGYQWQVNKNYNEARDFFSKALVAERSLVQGWFSRGVCNDKIGNYFKAQQDFSNALKLQMEIEFQRDQKAKTKKFTEKDVKKNNSRPKSAGANRAGREHASDHERLNQEVTSSMILFNRALVNVHTGDDDAALKDLENALSKEPNNIRARGARAMIQRRLGNFLECQSDYVRIEHIKKEEKQKEKNERMLQLAAMGHHENAKKGPAKKKRPSTAPTTRRRRVSSTDDRTRPKEELTPFEVIEGTHNEEQVKKEADLRRALEENMKKERQKRRETRGGNLGGLASTIDATPPASPMHGKIKVTGKDRANLEDLKLNLTEDIELVESDVDEDGGRKSDRDGGGEQMDAFTPLPTTNTMNQGNARVSFTPMAQTPIRNSLFSPLASTRSKGSFISKDALMVNAPSLAQVKKSLGVSEEIFDKLFSQPTSLQISLCNPPGSRVIKDLRKIVRVLGDFDITKNLTEEELFDLARKVEYRTVVESHDAFLQGEIVDSLVFVVSGTVQVKMRDSKQDSFVTGEVKNGEWFNDAAMLMMGAKEGTKYYDSSVRPERKGEDAELEEEGKDEEEKGGEGPSWFKKDPAALRETYHCKTNCEFLLFSGPLFEKYFRVACNEEQKKRFLAIKRSMVFKSWSTDALVRLARLSRMVTIPRNQKVVRQNEECDSMYFLVKGVAIVSKYPDKEAQLVRTLKELQVELDTSRTNYSFHRSLKSTRNTLKSMRRTKKLTLARGGRRIGSEGEGVQIPEEWVTAGEKKQEDIEMKIATVKRMIERCKKNNKVSQGKPEDAELAVLVPPAFFGSESVLDSISGTAHGTVTTDTVIRAVKVHRAVIRCFNIDRALLLKIGVYATPFPNDIVLDEEIRMNQGWDDYKARQMEVIRKGKWPVRKEGVIKNLPGGRSVIVESMEKKGDLLRGVF